MSMKISRITPLVFIMYYMTSCSSTIPSIELYKILNKNDINRLNAILNVVGDSISVSNAQISLEDFLDTWSDAQNVLRQDVINSRSRTGYPVRPDSAYLQGLADAKRDISTGNLRTKTVGLETILELKTLLSKSRWRPCEVYAYILKRNYSINVDNIASCDVDLPIKAYISAYNRISKSVINEFYGYDVFEKSWDDIRDTILHEGKYHKKEWQYTE